MSGIASISLVASGCGLHSPKRSNLQPGEGSITYISFSPVLEILVTHVPSNWQQPDGSEDCPMPFYLRCLNGNRAILTAVWLLPVELNMGYQRYRAPVES